MRVLSDKPEDIPLASHVRKMVTVFLFDEFDERRSSDGVCAQGDDSRRFASAENEETFSSSKRCS